MAYQFSVAYGNNPARIVRDFSRNPSFTWTPQVEGVYTITATVKAISLTTLISPTFAYGNTPTTQMSMVFTVTTTVTSQASISATTNPLVALYRAPSCPANDVIVVQFRALTTTPWTTTSAQPCMPPLTRPFYVAGMLPNTTYQMQHLVLSEPGNTVVLSSTIQTFQTGSLPPALSFTPVTVTANAHGPE